MTARDFTPTDELAQEIRRVDGRHDLGAGALAEALMPWLIAREESIIAAAKADTLREVASILRGEYVLWQGDFGVQVAEGGYEDATPMRKRPTVQDWLDQRADRIEGKTEASA